MSSQRSYSIGEVRRRLPRGFMESLSGGFPPGVVDRILHGMGAARATTLRVNTLKWNALDCIRFFNTAAVKHKRVQWYPDAFILTEARERDAERWPPYSEGKIYLQSLSSMLPVLALGPKPGESVLDIAAAPGSKTTQIAALMGNRGSLLANDASPVRAERLAYNLGLQGCSIVDVRVGRGEKLGTEMRETFDRVLLDVPCSGEGRFTLADPGTYRAWTPRTVTECARLQRRLFSSGVRALKPGGVLVYSTCTLNFEENEKMVAWAMGEFPLGTEDPPIRVPGALSGMADGLSPSVTKAIRILPSREMEGFFLCRLRKR
jgi:16S rRNA (cytosine1407-C5)-methyltransferase